MIDEKNVEITETPPADLSTKDGINEFTAVLKEAQAKTAKLQQEFDEYKAQKEAEAAAQNADVGGGGKKWLIGILAAAGVIALIFAAKRDKKPVAG